MRLRNLAERTVVALIGIPLLVFVVWFGKVVFLAFWDVVMVLALWELYGLGKKKGYHPFPALGIAMVLAVSWICYFHNGRGLDVVFGAAVILLMAIELFRGKPNPLANTGVTFFGAGYISLLSSFLLIRELPLMGQGSYRSGGWMVLLVFGTVWICDTAAYFGGVRFGKRPMFKRVSPKKTWEGAVFGFVAAVVSAVGLRTIILPSLGFWDAAAIGFLAGTMGQLSDLTESLFKRDAEVKDSSRLLPGHGGILDRFDSEILLGPLVYAYLILRGIVL
jgi:phosphatidate cytidylyltransferase